MGTGLEPCWRRAKEARVQKGRVLGHASEPEQHTMSPHPPTHIPPWAPQVGSRETGPPILLIICPLLAHSLQPGHPGPGQPPRLADRGHLQDVPEDRDRVLPHPAGGSGMPLLGGGMGPWEQCSVRGRVLWGLAGLWSSPLDQPPGCLQCNPCTSTAVSL